VKRIVKSKKRTKNKRQQCEVKVSAHYVGVTVAVTLKVMTVE